MTNKINSEQAVEHAWKYFELHSNQRITMFNYFLFIIAGLGTAIGVSFQSASTFAYIGIFCNEESNLSKANMEKNFVTKIITYGLIFRSTFLIMGLIGLIGVLVFSLIVFEKISFETPTKTNNKSTLN